jgi:hypothetical protein
MRKYAIYVKKERKICIHKNNLTCNNVRWKIRDMVIVRGDMTIVSVRDKYKCCKCSQGHVHTVIFIQLL